jgi:hypothetical protein
METEDVIFIRTRLRNTNPVTRKADMKNESRNNV